MKAGDIIKGAPIRVGSSGGCTTIRRNVKITDARPGSVLGWAMVYGFGTTVAFDLRGRFWRCL